MPYPSKNTDTPSFASKNTSTSSIPRQTLSYLETEAAFYLLQEDSYRLIIEPIASGYTYQTKN